jgi:hypothetical protein
MPIKDLEARKQYQKEYAQRNREKAYAKVKEWRANNPELWAEQSKRYLEKYPEKSVIRTIRWRDKNPEHAAKIAKKSRVKNKARIVANKAAYRAGKTSRTPAWLTDFDKLKIKCIYSIAAMLTRENKEPWHVDHIVPLHGKAVSGLHVPSNLWFIRGVENHLKNNKFGVDYA